VAGVTPGAAIAGADAPPLALPGSHFAAAALFLLAGALGLVLAAPDLAAGAHMAPGVTATTHLFTLGWITTSIVGALYQLLPVALGVPIRSPRAAWGTLVLYLPGLPLFLIGVWSGSRVATVGGALLLAAGLLLFAANLALTLARARREGADDVAWWALAGADLFLVITVLLGSALAGNLHGGWLGGGRLLALGVHLHVALAGWVLLVVVGVAQRLLPMFLLSHGADDRRARLAVGLITAGLLVLLAAHHGPRPLGVWLPAALVLAGAVAFLAQAGAFYRTRRRPRLDAGMGLAAAALAVVGVGVLLALPVLATGGGAGRLATAYGLCLVLGLSVFVAAHYYKIVPFLVWYHRFGPRVGKQPVPMVAELYRGDLARAAGVLLVVGTATLLVSTTLGHLPLARAGAVLFLAGAVVEVGQMATLTRKRPAPPSEPAFSPDPPEQRAQAPASGTSPSGATHDPSPSSRSSA